MTPISTAPCYTQQNWYPVTGSNRRHSRCKRDALPTELTGQTIYLFEHVYANGFLCFHQACSMDTEGHELARNHSKELLLVVQFLPQSYPFPKLVRHQGIEPCLPRSKPRGCTIHVPDIIGASRGTRTPTVARCILSAVRLPISPYSHKLIVLGHATHPADHYLAYCMVGYPFDLAVPLVPLATDRCFAH
jgi:hypothetical protein